MATLRPCRDAEQAGACLQLCAGQSKARRWPHSESSRPQLPSRKRSCLVGTGVHGLEGWEGEWKSRRGQRNRHAWSQPARPTCRLPPRDAGRLTGSQLQHVCDLQLHHASHVGHAAFRCKLASSWHQAGSCRRRCCRRPGRTHAFHGMQRSTVPANAAAYDQQVVIELLAAGGGRRGRRRAVLAGRLRAHRAASGSKRPAIVGIDARSRCTARRVERSHKRHKRGNEPTGHRQVRVVDLAHEPPSKALTGC